MVRVRVCPQTLFAMQWRPGLRLGFRLVKVIMLELAVSTNIIVDKGGQRVVKARVVSVRVRVSEGDNVGASCWHEHNCGQRWRSG